VVVTVIGMFPPGAVLAMAKLAVILVPLFELTVIVMPVPAVTVGLDPNPLPLIVTFETVVPIRPCAGEMLGATGTGALACCNSCGQGFLGRPPSPLRMVALA